MKPVSKPFSRGAAFGGETLTVIPASATIRPLRDQIVLESVSEPYSRYLQVVMQAAPLEGVVLAVGPGCYPKLYDHADKHKRTKTWDSKAFRPTDVKVGDRVKLGDGEITNNSFQRFWWGDRLCLICREQDICGVVDSTSLGEGAAPERQKVQRRKSQDLPALRGRAFRDVPF